MENSYYFGIPEIGSDHTNVINLISSSPYSAWMALGQIVPNPQDYELMSVSTLDNEYPPMEDINDDEALAENFIKHW